MSPAPNAFKPTSLERVLDQNEAIQDAVEQSAAELCVVNAVLMHEVPDHLKTSEVAQAIERTEELENRIQTSADDLAQVNLALQDEISLRADLERQLASTQAALEEAQAQAQVHFKAKHLSGQGSAAR